MSVPTKTTKPTDAFKLFPEFSKLTLADREKYEALIKDFEPASGWAFYNLMTWWNTLDSCAVSSLNSNLVLSYWMPGDDKMSGLSVVGTKKIDETFAEIFESLRSRGEKVKMVHVPEFVVSKMKYPELYHFKNEHFNDEYVYKVSRFASLEGLAGFKRARIKRFLLRHERDNLEVRQLDLSISENRQLLIDREEELRGKSIFGFAKHVSECLTIALDQAPELDTQNLCFFIDGRLEGYLIYSVAMDERYITFSHAVINMRIPYIYDYLVYAYAKWFQENDIEYVNLDSDLGMPVLRMIKLALGPDHYFRFYTVKPVKVSV